MPLYDFQCRVCGNRFEALVRLSTPPECPACHSVDLERLLSSFGVSSAGSRRSNAEKSRKDQIRPPAAIRSKASGRPNNIGGTSTSIGNRVIGNRQWQRNRQSVMATGNRTETVPSAHCRARTSPSLCSAAPTSHRPRPGL